MTERLHFHFSLSCIGEGNGNPLQSSCLENPRNGGAWWAAVYGVAQSRTRLKRLSSSSRWWCHLVASLQICKRPHLFKFSISGSNIFIFPFPTLFQLLPCYLISSYYLFYSVKFVRKISKHTSPIMANKRISLYIYPSISTKEKKKKKPWDGWHEQTVTTDILHKGLIRYFFRVTQFYKCSVQLSPTQVSGQFV